VSDPALWNSGADCCYASVRFPDGKLAFRVDASRGIVEIAQRGQLHYFDLRMIQAIDK